jgi:hypothetical protein
MCIFFIFFYPSCLGAFLSSSFPNTTNKVLLPTYLTDPEFVQLNGRPQVFVLSQGGPTSNFAGAVSNNTFVPGFYNNTFNATESGAGGNQTVASPTATANNTATTGNTTGTWIMPTLQLQVNNTNDNSTANTINNIMNDATAKASSADMRITFLRSKRER